MLLFSDSRLKGMAFRVLVDGSEREAVAQVKETRREECSFYYSQRDEKQDPALNRWGHESDPFCR